MDLQTRTVLTAVGVATLWLSTMALDPSVASELAPLGTVVFEANFDGPDALRAWTPAGAKPGIAPGPGGAKCVVIEQSAAQVPRLRGAMIDPTVTAADLELLAGQWKANHVPWQLTWGGFPRSPADGGDLAAYDRWLNLQLFIAVVMRADRIFARTKQHDATGQTDR